MCSFCKNINIRKRSDFCSEKCRQKSKYKRKTSQICLVCNKPSLKLSNYCSTKCYDSDHYTKTKIENQCKFCKNNFIKNIISGFCSPKCRNAFNYWDNNKKGLCSCGKKLFNDYSCCEDCYNKRKTYKPEGPRPLEQQIFNSATARAKKKKIPMNITIDDIVVPEYCPVLNIKLERGIGKAQYNSPSLDRIIPELGYVKGNIMIISHKANTIKNNSTIKEVEQVLIYMKTYSN
jgi:hypothetical protein